MVLTFECVCGNQTGLFATGDRDEQGREYLEAEDDDRISWIMGDTGMLFKCSFCGHTYRLEKQ
ncbi:hypothetical protein [Paenibacillus sp. Leaf72]|uniref:hypothetical protein n=1 Tax=Paenibacillus sp. Leaf72 TaxID=1736234 RepID=UPI0007011A88|nr:hypothetical protein [Paenibacillus sp. Leaf72]KQO17313.1 hypothetical protein ASF12_01050 [Paenibacillus sp. Leaf72]